ncbi:M48 family metallopeptidase [Pseudorhodoferax sp. LjRoot39]|uniref:M48 family metallopeptidase n=1 Tax=Pseudorhodoferax sp. LjRoot39 TaxID=3342328 RepID=UPI003ECF3A21
MKPLKTLVALGLAGALLSTPALAQREGVNVGQNSVFTGLVSADQMEATALQQYRQVLREAAQQNALAPANNPQLQRLRAIATRIIPHAVDWNPRAKDWKWEVNLIGSKQVNAWCMPGGKIAFYTGILNQLKLSDDEVAAVMGHEIAHALREHARERAGKSAATNLGANVFSELLGLGTLGRTVVGGGVQLIGLSFSRENETDADLVGLELSARAGYDPRAAVTLWQKMNAASQGAPPQWLSTHPAGSTRITSIERNLPKVMPLYERAKSGG